MCSRRTICSRPPPGSLPFARPPAPLRPRPPSPPPTARPYLYLRRTSICTCAASVLARLADVSVQESPDLRCASRRCRRRSRSSRRRRPGPSCIFRPSCWWRPWRQPQQKQTARYLFRGSCCHTWCLFVRVPIAREQGLSSHAFTQGR